MIQFPVKGITREITGRICTASLLVSSEESGSWRCHENLTQRLVSKSIDLSFAFSVEPETIWGVWFLAFRCEIIEKAIFLLFLILMPQEKAIYSSYHFSCAEAEYPTLLGLAWPLVIYLYPRGISIHCSTAGLGFYAHLLPAIKPLLDQHLYNLLCSRSDRHETLFFTCHLITVARLSDKHSSPLSFLFWQAFIIVPFASHLC